MGSEMCIRDSSLSQFLSFPFLSPPLNVSTFVLFPKDSEKYVEELLSLFNRFSKLVDEAFHDDPRFLTARDKVGKEATSNSKPLFDQSVLLATGL